jgi:predicted GNAT family acetyltransferase
VTTGMGLTIGSYVGVFNIATPPARRRRGYGAAVTVRAVADGVAAGARWAWLQSSGAGYPVYDRLGFRTTEDWNCWLSTSPHPA